MSKDYVTDNPAEPLELELLKVEQAQRLKLAIFRVINERYDAIELHDRKRSLLAPQILVDQALNAIVEYKETLKPKERLWFYLTAGEAVLNLRCQTDLTTGKDLTTPPRIEATARLPGQTRKKDRLFEMLWGKAQHDSRRAYLLLEYAGRNVVEIADLFERPLEYVEEQLLLEELILAARIS